MKGALAMRRALAGDLMPRTVFFQPTQSSIEAHLSAVLARDPGATWSVEERTAKAEKEYDHVFAGPKGLFDMELEVRFDDEDPFAVSPETCQELSKWVFSQSWEVIQSSDLDRAAIKIQGQARRRRDANKVRRIQEEQDASKE
eukprot:CAMPEP_0206234022 /NCGR_PEP_ID=MMETSP0047_2-20121206/12342_1 /ASSEMBLY_ACC=CAM_ASM_000192 /TAXON_ID=195065 /ORGANISM="Chroomonas mesostigmatica_cf, Strain CCMP1168" /LENGTH=142 /DNA_ID=CAMNT_0053658027 /DNA_START=248 /DNA_END=676 /DNA_ORIENTATION=+